jgi:4-hydroxybenzoyl-CoA reductase subunit beta
VLRLPPFEYHRPSSIEEALRLLEELGDAAMVVAGGTDVVPNMKHGLHDPAHLISLRGIPSLRGVEADERTIRIGAAETLSDIGAHPAIVARVPALAEAARHVAGPQIRNVATLGGNLCLDTRCTYYNQSHFWRRSLGYCLKKDGDTCHVTQVGKKCVAAHSADTPPVLWALGATVELASSAGGRELLVEDFFVADGIRNTVREPAEIVTGVRIPTPGPDVRMAYRKVRPRSSIDFPVLTIAVVADLEGEERIRSLRIVVSALGSRPREVTGLEEVAGRSLDRETVDAVAARSHQQCRPLTNIIVDPEWRRAMVPVHVRRALESLTGDGTLSPVASRG